MAPGVANLKLEQQKTMLMDVQSKLEKYHELGGAASKILTSLDQRLKRLETTILPVYNETEHLQRRQQNLESTLTCLDNVLSHYDASQEVCNLIHLGPNEHDITQFLEALEKLKKAQEYFLHNNPQSVELENVTSLFNSGCEALNNHFKYLLKKHCAPLKPVDLLDLIYVEEDTSNDDCPSIKQLPPTAREELQVICVWLDQNVRREYVNIYATERADVVFRSLNMLKDHQRSGSWGAEPVKRGGPSAGGANTGGYYSKGERKSTSARLQSIFERKANKMLQKASQTIEQSRFALKKSADNLTADDYIGTDGNQDLEKYLVLLLGLQRLLIWERQILMDIVPSGRVVEVFSRLAQPSIDMVVRDVESITAKVTRSIGRKEWTAALGIFSALKDVIILQPDIEKVCDATQAHQLGMVVTRLQHTGTKALEQFLDLVRSESGGNLVGGAATSVPRDATVHELTSNSIWFLEHLADHWDVIGGILQMDVVYSNQLEALHKSFPTVEDKKRALLGIYYKKALSELNLTILSKCDQYSDLATRHLFRLNNIHYILKSMQRTNLLDVVSLAEPECESNYQQLIRELKKSYQRTWSKLLANVGQLEELPRVSHGVKLKDKERSLIKDRFSAFNKELEEICRVQRSLSVPDILLREGLKRDNAENIVPKYNTFFEMFNEVQFSKNPEKYIRNRPEDVSNLLNSLFDDTV